MMMDVQIRQLLGVCLVAVAWLGFAEPAVGQTGYPSVSTPPQMEASAGDGDVAVIVAIEEYVFLPDVPGATSNANDWETYFRRGLGMEEVRVLSDRQASRGNILDFADRAAEDVGKGGRLWFVFIGHGAPAKDGDDGLLIGMDARSSTKSLSSRSVPQKTLLGRLEAGDQSETMVVLDACFSGRAHGGEPLVEGAQPVVPVVEPEIGAGATVLSAAKAEEVAGSLPGADRPAFSYLLLGALRGWADDGDGAVTTSEALAWTRKMLRLVPDRQQTPTLFGSRDAVLARGATATDPGISTSISRISRADEKRRRSRPAEETAGDGDREQPACPDGKIRNEDTLGNCCWPGQSWNGRRCVGTPETCPGAFVREEDSCVLPTCENGRVRAPDGKHCCWPEQGWSSTKEACIGDPSCPEGMMRGEGNSCRADTDGDGIPDADDQCPDDREDLEGVADGDGCPEKDADGDGISDAEDECPERAEDDDGVEVDDGCPESGDGDLTGPYALGGTGAVASVVGAGLLTTGAIMHANLGARLESAAGSSGGAIDPAELSHEEAYRIRNQAKSLQTAGGLAVGFGSAAVLGALLWMDGDVDRPFWARPGVSVAPTPGGFAIRASIVWP